MINKNRIEFGAFSGNDDYPDFLDIQIKSFQDFFQLDTDAENRNQEGLFKVFNEKSWNLLETLAEEIKSSLMSDFSILDCSIKIRKPEVKLQYDVDFVELSLFGNQL